MRIGWIGFILLALCCVKLVYAASETAVSTDVSTDVNNEDLIVSTDSQISPSQLFNQAVEHFKEKRYQRAIDLFVSANQRGLNIAKLHFNLGSAYYKLQQYDDALASFTTAAKDNKLEVLSRINMSLCLLKLSRPKPAEQQLQRAVELTRNTKFLYLIQSIASKNQLTLPDTVGAARWQSAYSIFYGTNDNVLLQDDINVNNESKEDNFLQTSISTALQSAGLFKLRLALQTTNYSQLTNYNYIQLNIEPELRVGKQHWRYSLTTVYQPSALDGKQYLRTTELRNKLRYQFNPAYHLESTISVYEFTDRSPESAHLSGHAIKRGLSVAYQAKQFTLSLSAHTQAENRTDYKPLDPVLGRSFSPRSRESSFQARANLSSRDFLNLSVQSRRSQYPFDSQVDSRVDRRLYIYLNFAHEIKKSYWLLVTANLIKNESNNDLYQFRSNAYLFGLSGTF